MQCCWWAHEVEGVVQDSAAVVREGMQEAALLSASLDANAEHSAAAIAALQSQTITGARIVIPVKRFPMLAWVVVGETYDGRNHGQLSCSCSYIFRVTGRVVVGETYDLRDDDRC